ncbi:cyclic nucleotide-binding domain-containing protein [Spirosoma sp. HMF4905]|uniref:Cyclic nucleotide-binding domain-containing protein n=1 Tax=Spirosoma arboris TaxID=2682092 RepID=A0A7K1SE87_9BACT|nr:Crp/Fnr family transcriptional regulator [Spirosoma arboris]MVM32101.1 cyclic nucleotide-binding domain-containing protein [Spirosoma arboris]
MFEVFRKYLSSKANLSDADFERIKAVSVIKKLRKHQYLLQEGDVWRSNAFVAKGCLRRYQIDAKGQEHILTFATENWWIGDRDSLLTGNPAISNIDAIEDSEVVLINKENFDQLCQQLPTFNEFIQTILQKSFIASQNRIYATISYTAEEKYQNFISTRPELANRVPQHMIASYLGISAETLSRVRNQMTKK